MQDHRKKQKKNKEHQAPAGNNQTEPYGRRHWHNIFKEKIKGKSGRTKVRDLNKPSQPWEPGQDSINNGF